LSIHRRGRRRAIQLPGAITTIVVMPSCARIPRLQANTHAHILRAPPPDAAPAPDAAQNDTGPSSRSLFLDLRENVVALFPDMLLQDVEGDGNCWLYSFCVGLMSQANTAEELKRLMEVLRRTEVGRWLLDENRLVPDTNQDMNKPWKFSVAAHGLRIRVVQWIREHLNAVVSSPAAVPPHEAHLHNLTVAHLLFDGKCLGGDGGLDNVKIETYLQTLMPQGLSGSAQPGWSDAACHLALASLFTINILQIDTKQNGDRGTLLRPLYHGSTNAAIPTVILAFVPDCHYWGVSSTTARPFNPPSLGQAGDALSQNANQRNGAEKQQGETHKSAGGVQGLVEDANSRALRKQKEKRETVERAYEENWSELDSDTTNFLVDHWFRPGQRQNMMTFQFGKGKTCFQVMTVQPTRGAEFKVRMCQGVRHQGQCIQFGSVIKPKRDRGRTGRVMLVVCVLVHEEGFKCSDARVKVVAVAHEVCTVTSVVCLLCN
jgi:hypothetical protein